jgi:L-lactate utilization protein LutB
LFRIYICVVLIALFFFFLQLLQERVEEDRYMRAQETAWKEKLRALKDQEEHERLDAHYQDVVKPVMGDVAEMLEGTGDKVSKKGLEVLAKWKLDL